MSWFIEKVWYGKHPLQWVLWPFSLIYQAITWLRSGFLKKFKQTVSPVPVIVVGNITVGGVGKTPLVIAIAQKLQQKGVKVGIVSRGYGAKNKQFPYEVQKNDTASWVGDEPLLMARKALCPVVIAPKRSKAILYLQKKHQVQVVISDDGLQHYAMGRSLEIAVLDGKRGLGNEKLLPAGPLRESKKRLEHVDFIVVNEGDGTFGFDMHLSPTSLTNLLTEKTINPQELTKRVAAVAAIGNPQRFYSTLSQLGIEFSEHSYPDHYQFKPKDFIHFESWVVMTEKDAVKCQAFASDHMVYLPVEAQLSQAFWSALWTHKQLKGYF